ncbi:flagellar filament capping protein FliD [Solirubrobacter phytolaccae]|uniref:Flagellar hook-associated protein 2 n=1 Tax=Solirubrobacter phytolaccae TaxID=1404360 RepID=A0A9X3ND25_9ACTN|nr:flagellar filament capping protein FliD [Solirubrobacter phytolaccae]MDA0183871.1 flagellar filament capping protein FliD [Solirubrobacter phytolaccae]
MAISLSGMASGLDTDSIITQLMQIEQTKVTAVQKRQVSVTQHQTDLKAIKTKLDAVKTAAADLQAASLWKPAQATASSDATKVDVSVLGGAGIGGHTIQVNKLASSAQHGFTFDPQTTAGTLSFYYGNDPNAAGASKIDIPVAANATATDVATLINANDKAPVYAAVVKENGTERLVFSSRKTGENSNFTVDTSALADASKMTELASFKREGTILNADVVVDGQQLNPETNVLEAAVPGLRMTLKGVTTSPVSVTTTQPAVDSDAIAKKITALVDAYNAVVTSTRAELTEKRVPTANTTADLQKGQLFGDTGMTSMLNSLKSTMTKTLSGLGLTGLKDLGIDVPKAGTNAADARAGKLTIDTEKLKTAIANDYTKVKELFAGQGATKGLSAVISDYVGTQTGTNGVLTSRISGDDKTLTGFNDQITKLNTRMETEQKRLKAQFAAMETALNTSQTQQAWLTSQIATLG